jgi:hypothetical protein
MSFKCGSCKRTGKKPHRIVIKKRSFDHFEPQFNDELDKVVPTFMGHGDQIVEEKNLCDQCVK